MWWRSQHKRPAERKPAFGAFGICAGDRLQLHVRHLQPVAPGARFSCRDMLPMCISIAGKPKLPRPFDEGWMKIQDDLVLPPLPPISYERLMAEIESLGAAMEMLPTNSGDECRAVLARIDRRVQQCLWRSQYSIIAAMRSLTKARG